ncbi:MAG: Ig domain-containing protein, partial [Singulisphaera sp.]
MVFVGHGARQRVPGQHDRHRRSAACGDRIEPHATQLIVAWASASEDGSGDGVYAQRYNLNGAAIGAPFRVNTTTSGNQTAPAVAMDSLGDFVIVWQSAGQDGSGDGIYGRRYGYDATPLAGEFRVNSTTTGNQQAPAIAMNDTGAFAVAFQSASRDASGNAVVARVYSAAGTALASDFQVNQFTSGDQQAPSIAMAASGQFIVSWQSAAQDGNGDAIVARRYGSTGTALAAEAIVNQTTAGNQDAPSVAANSDGSYVIAWQSAGQDGNSDAVVARRYDASGVAQGNEFQVNQFTTGSQSAPSVTSADSSGFVVAWQSAGQDGNSDAVVARQYSATGTASGNEFVVNTFAAGAQNNPWIAMEADGDFLVAWQSASQETGGGTSLGVFARRYSAVNDAPVMREISNQITDVGGTISFTAKADDEDLPVDSLSYSLAPGAPVGATINTTTGAFNWPTAGVDPGRYFVTVQAQ